MCGSKVYSRILQPTVLVEIKFARHTVVSKSATATRTFQDRYLVVIRNRCTIQSVHATIASLAIRYNQLMVETCIRRRQVGGRISRARRLERINFVPAAQVAVRRADADLESSLVPVT
jgi:hypothetical protein